MKKILIVTNIDFWEKLTGSQNRIDSLVDYLSNIFNITVFYFGFLPPRNIDRTKIKIFEYNNHLINVYFILRLELILRKKIKWLFKIKDDKSDGRYSNTYEDFIDNKLSARFDSFLDSNPFDVVIIEYADFTYLIENNCKKSTTIMLDTMDIQHLRNESFRAQGKTPPFVINKEKEIELFSKYDYLIAIQKRECEIMEAFFPGKSILAMHPCTINNNYRVRSSVDKMQISFFSGHQDHNIEALDWFLKHIWDRELRKFFTLNIYGSIANVAYCKKIKPGEKDIVVKGLVKQPSDAYAHADIAINPTQFGSGLKIKNVEAIAVGIPLLTTSVGAEGLEEGIGSFLMVADTAGEFRKAMLRLRDHDLRKMMSASALKYAKKNLTPEACYTDLVRVIQNG